MRLGIIGLPQSGKTTVFNALTRGNQPTVTSGGRFEVNTAVVDVPDRRVDRLVEMFRPRKVTLAKVTYADITGLEGRLSGSSGQGKSSNLGLSGPLLNQLSQMDGFLHVVRCFENTSVPHPSGEVNAQRDIESMDSELILNDMLAVERKLTRLSEERRKGGGRERAAIERETNLFERFKDALSYEQPLREVEVSPEEEKILAGYALLTRKPLLLLLNLSDTQDAPDIAYDHARSAILTLRGKLEMDLAQLPREDAQTFMAEFGIQELGLQRVITASYDLLGLQSFFTVGEDEVRAWTVQRNASAYEAAGAIHSDLQKGFIRAEVVSYQDLLELGGLVEARSKGRLRLEGREYIVQDGDIVHIRFNL